MQALMSGDSVFSLITLFPNPPWVDKRQQGRASQSDVRFCEAGVMTWNLHIHFLIGHPENNFRTFYGRRSFVTL
jgi:hypothetical protein